MSFHQQQHKIDITESDEDDNVSHKKTKEISCKLNGKNIIWLPHQKIQSFMTQISNNQTITLENILYIIASINLINAMTTPGRVGVIGLERVTASIQNTSGVKLKDFMRFEIKICIFEHINHYYMLILTNTNSFHLNLLSNKNKTKLINCKPSKMVYKELAKYLFKKGIITRTNQAQLRQENDLIYPTNNYFTGNNCGIQAALFTAEIIKMFNKTTTSISRKNIQKTLDSKFLVNLFNHEHEMKNYIITCLKKYCNNLTFTQNTNHSLPKTPQTPPKPPTPSRTTTSSQQKSLRNIKKRTLPTSFCNKPIQTYNSPFIPFTLDDQPPPTKKIKISKEIFNKKNEYKKQNESMQQQLHKINTINQNYKKKIELLEKKINQKELEIKNIQQQKQTEKNIMQETMNSLKIKNKTLNNNFTKQQHEMIKLKQDYDQLQNKCKRIESENTKLLKQKQQIENLEKQILSLTDEDLTLKKQNQMLNAKNLELRTTITTSKDHLTKIQQEFKTLEDKYQKLSDSHELIQKKQKSLSITLNEQQETNKQLQYNIANDTIRIKKQQNEIHELNQENATWKENCNVYHAQRQQTVNIHEQLIQKYDKIIVEYHHLQTQNIQLQDDYDKLIIENNDLVVKYKKEYNHSLHQADTLDIYMEEIRKLENMNKKIHTDYINEKQWSFYYQKRTQNAKAWLEIISSSCIQLPLNLLNELTFYNPFIEEILTTDFRTHQLNLECYWNRNIKNKKSTLETLKAVISVIQNHAKNH